MTAVISPRREAFKERQRQRYKALWADPVYRQKMSDKLKAKWTERAYREKVVESITGVPKSAEARASMSKAQAGRAVSAATREIMRVAGKQRWSDPVYKAANAFTGHTQESRNKMVLAHLGKRRSVESRKKQAATQVKQYAEGTRKRVEYTPELIAKMIHVGVKRSKEAREKTSAALRAVYRSGDKQPVAHPWRHQFYQGVQGSVVMKSTYELLFARWLDGQGIAWEYEPKVFDLQSTTYRPDFFLSASGFWIEIKGYFSPKAQSKVALFQQLYPKERFCVLQAEALRLLGLPV
jgi:hypothetical protein